MVRGCKRAKYPGGCGVGLGERVVVVVAGGEGTRLRDTGEGCLVIAVSEHRVVG